MITTEQIASRKGKLGASDSAAALGLSPWESPAGLAARLMGLVEETEENDFMRLGNIMESAIAAGYTQKTGVHIKPYQTNLSHSKFKWLIAHPDYYFTLPGSGSQIVEIKNVGPRMISKWGEDGNPEGAPVYVVTQCVQQALLAGVGAVDVCAYFGGDDLRVYPLVVDQKAKDALLSGVVHFWTEYIQKGKLPEPDYRDLDLLKKLYPRSTDREIVATKELQFEIDLYRGAEKELKRVETDADHCKARIQNAMADASILKNRDGDWEFTWKTSKDSEKTDWKIAFQKLETAYLIECNENDEDRDTEMELGEAVVSRILEQNTTTVPGSRRFLDKFKE